MANVEINSLEDAKVAAAKYGVEWPEGRGKPPVVRLRTAIEAKGDTITGSYVKPRAEVLKPAAPGKRDYDVTLIQTIERKPDSKGRVRKVKKDVVLRFNVTELRDALNKHQRGTLGRSNIVAALVKLRDAKDTRVEMFSDEEIAAAMVKAVDVTAATAAKAPVKAPSKPRKPSNGTSKAKTAPPVVEPVTADVQPEAIAVSA